MELKSTNHESNGDFITPIWKLSPMHNGGSSSSSSNLLDSYELQAITKQLNRAIRASNGQSTPRSPRLLSPFYLHRLDRIYKQNSNTSKKISSSKQNSKCTTTEVKGTRGFVLRLWNKVKQGFLRGNKFNT
ncbi:hypothetical protein ABFS83_09G044600 [Erythranthe nasuta]